MNAIEIFNISEKIKKYEGLKINEVTLKALLSGQAGKFYSKDFKNYKFSIGATGDIQVELYNSSDDEDEHGIVGDILRLNEDKGILKYLAVGSTKLVGSGSGNGKAFNLNQFNNAVYSVYKIHSFQDDINRAVETDLSKFISVLDMGDTEEPLSVGDAVALHVQGTLEAGIELSYSDIFLSNLSSLSKLLSKNEFIKLRFKPDITLGFDVSISDTFTLIFFRNIDQQYTVMVKKADISQFGGSLKAGIHVEFADPKQLTRVLNDVLENLLETTEDKIENIISKRKTDDLSDTQKEVFEVLLDKLGLESVTSKLDALRSKYHVLKEEAKETIEKIARAKVEAGFTYEYQRISTKSILFEGRFDKKALNKYHFDLLSGNLKNIVHSFRNGNPDQIEVNAYFDEKKIEKRRAIGFSLGFIGAFNKEDIDQVIRKNIQGSEQVAFSGHRKYENKFFGETTAWEVDFNVEMPNFSAHAVPLANEFNYSIYLALQWQDRRLKNKEELLQYLDQGVLWKAIPQGEIDMLAQELFPNLRRKAVTVTSQLKFNKDTFKLLLPKIDFYNRKRRDIQAMALGAAMAYDKDHDIKRNVKLRSKYYGQVWKQYLENPGIAGESNFVSIAYQTLKPVSPQLAKKELNPNRNTHEESLRLSALTPKSVANFNKGINHLHSGIQQVVPYTEIILPSYREMRAFWSVPFHTRALGYYLVSLAGDLPPLVGEQEVERIFTITYPGEGGKEEVINLTTNL